MKSLEEITATPLTEQQARALAHWWGGRYEELPDTAGQSRRHGVVLTLPSAAAAVHHGVARALVLTQEEARAWETQRGFQEACSPDWVG